MDEAKTALLNYLIQSPLWLICIALLVCQGYLFLLVFFGFDIKKIKKLGKIKVVLPIGIAISCLAFAVQNLASLREQGMTLELLESHMLSSILTSFAIMCVIAIIILPVHEVKRNKRGEK